MSSSDLFEQLVCAATWDQKATAENKEGLPCSTKRRKGDLDAFHGPSYPPEAFSVHLALTVLPQLSDLTASAHS